MKTIKRLVYGLVGLSIFIWANGVLAQPVQILRIPANGFSPTSDSASYYKNIVVLSTTETGSFYFPVTLPNGSVIKQIELNCFDNDTPGYISLRLYETINVTFDLIASVSSSNATTVQSIKSSETTHPIDYSTYAYTLAAYFAPHTTTLNFFSAVIYYLPPTSLSYLPMITN
jgi:hypothetical protein